MPDDVLPREQVPSAREVAAGIAAEFHPEPPPEVFVGERWRDRALGSVKSIDPRAIAGPGQRLPLVVLALLTTVGTFDNSAFGLVLPFIKVDMGFDLAFLLTIQSIVGIIVTLTSPLGGWLADRVQRVRMVQIGSLLDNVSTIASGLAPGPGLLVGSRIAGSFGPALTDPAVFPLMADYFPVEKRARVFGFTQAASALFQLVSGLFLVFGVLIGGWLTWRQLLVGAGVVATGVSLLTFLLKEPVRGEVDRLAMGATADRAKEEQKPVAWAEAWRVAQSIRTLRKLWLAEPFITVANLALGNIMFFAVQERLAQEGQLTGFFSRPEVARALPAVFVVLPSLARLLLAPILTARFDRLLREAPGRILYVAGTLQLGAALGVFLVFFLPNIYVAVLASALLQSLAVAAVPARDTVLSVVIPARIRGQGFQTIKPFTLIGYLLLPFLGVLSDRYGATAAAVGLIPVLVAGCLILTSSGANVERDMRAALAASLAAEESRASRESGTNKMVVARSVEVAYGGTQVLFGVDLDVAEGEILALLGTNGAGKSTLLKAICGIQEASGGAIFLDGEDITHKPPHLNARDGIVFLPGGRAIFPTLTVAENLKAAAWLYRSEDEYLRTRTEEVLELFPVLRERLDTLAGNMSGGEQQMLALGQAFLMRPRLLMIDELSLGLAPAIVERLLEIVRTIHAHGTTIILVEQSVNVALTIAERAVFMEKGEVRFDGPTQDLLDRGDLVRAVFLGAAAGRFIGVARTRPLGDVQTAVPALEVEDVEVSYGGVQALRGVSLAVREGEVVGVLGPNGAGKTTLMDVISGFTRPSAGTVRIAGVEATSSAPAARAHLGLARSFQDTRLFPSLTVRENVAVALAAKLKVRSPLLSAVWAPNMRRSERRVYRRVDYLIELLNLTAYADKFVNELSTGSRRMVDLACVTAAEPRVLLLDEPSSGMAQGEIELLGPVVQRLAHETGAGVLVIEHDLPLAKEMSDRLIVMELGAVLATGPAAEVLDRPEVKRAYLNASQSVINRSGELFKQALAALDLDPDEAGR